MIWRNIFRWEQIFHFSTLWRTHLISNLHEIIEKPKTPHHQFWPNFSWVCELWVLRENFRVWGDSGSIIQKGFFWRKMWRLHHFVWWWFIIECSIFLILSRLFDHMTDPKPLIFYAKIFVHEALFINELSCSRLGICIFPCGLALELNANSKMSPLPSWLQSTCFTSLCLSRLSRDFSRNLCFWR